MVYFIPSFIFNLSVSVYLKCISCRQHVFWSWILSSLLILDLWIGMVIGRLGSNISSCYLFSIFSICSLFHFFPALLCMSSVLFRIPVYLLCKFSSCTSSFYVFSDCSSVCNIHLTYQVYFPLILYKFTFDVRILQQYNSSSLPVLCASVVIYFTYTYIINITVYCYFYI